MTQLWRVEGEGLIDRQAPLNFKFNGRTYQGFEGDTLASGLLANGVRLLGRSFKYHRPRGIMAHGSEEPNALVRLMDRSGGGKPSARATLVKLHEGLEVQSQHHWPTLEFDVGVVNNWLGRFLGAGFYYKTFMWPRRWWPSYEHILRKAAGLGAPPTSQENATASQQNVHIDVLIAGGGPAGLAAALAAGRTGATVILADDGLSLGGSLLDTPMNIAAGSTTNWLTTTLHELGQLKNVQLMPRTVVTGYYDHEYLTMVQAADTAGTNAKNASEAAQVYWKVRASQVVFATGSIERPLVFPGNDRPGVMLVASVASYLHRYRVLCGREVVLYTNNDSAYGLATALQDAGASIRLIVDARATLSPCGQALLSKGVRVVAGARILGTRGSTAISGIQWEGAGGDSGTTACDLLAVSGGWTPRVHLFSQARGTLRYAPELAGFVPNVHGGRNHSAGACNGQFDTAECIGEGVKAGLAASRASGYECVPEIEKMLMAGSSLKFTGLADGQNTWLGIEGVEQLKGREKAFVDFQNDVTVDDVLQAAREGYKSVEHLKRYTTLGMGTDQGKLSNLNGLEILARQLGQTPGQTGTTTFRPPYVPIDMATVAGPTLSHPAHPVRRLATHDWQVQNGAFFTQSAPWLRPQFYRQAGETDLQAVNREVNAVRNGVGLIDVSPLGKVELHGPDVIELLNRIYANRWDKLAVGRAKFGVILREDGMVLDDSVVARIGEFHYVMSTSTAHSKTVPEHIAYCMQTMWPHLRVCVTPVSEQWATFALAGQSARAVLEKLDSDIDFSAKAMPHMSTRLGRLLDIKTRITRMSFSGELSYEISVPAADAMRLWTALIDAGTPLGLAVYGTEAMGVLRIEKGHFVVGREATGTATLDDLGLGGLLDRSKDCIGMRSLALPAHTDSDRLQLVGAQCVDPNAKLPPGAHIVASDQLAVQESLGYLTSQCFSPTLGRSIGLAMVQAGRSQIGKTLYAVSPVANESVAIQLTDSCFVDSAGERLHA
ncbi:2Fe-2S iron-sulfur cluster-binding protein [Ottowia thiooxydans]|uniref:2Fe-2S iron-sulfur cluster-binding protein n=1 Tax=Ottowia thiooxydans TaxID=219182 RepID=UPI00040F2BD1|nr:2Fe-2S iron-sulfur cluster-binding protein [Ottowia thiooxydans]